MLSFEEFASRAPAAAAPVRDFKKAPKWFPLTMSIFFGVIVLFFIIGFIAEPNTAEDNTGRYLMFAGIVVIFGIFVANTNNISRKNHAVADKEKQFQEAQRAYEVDHSHRMEQLRKEYDVYVQNHSRDWQKAMSRWELLYYCRRDNILFIPGASRQVAVKGKELKLTATEYKMLSYICQNAGRVVTPDQLLDKVWGEEYIGAAHLLQVNIARLRKKLGDDAKQPEYIITRSGIGYIMPKAS